MKHVPAIAIAALALVCICAANDAQTADIVWVKLPERKDIFPPNAVFFDILNTAVCAATNAPARPALILVSDSPAASYARLVLESYGISGVAAMNSVSPAAKKTISALIGAFTEEEAKRFMDAGHDVRRIETVATAWAPTGAGRRTVIVVLGNEPLDGETPTVDMTKRVLKGVELVERNRGARLLLTGGATSDAMSEARMMALIAMSRGVPWNSILMEEKARGTSGNAEYSAELLDPAAVDRVYVVSKSDHLQWAMPLFKGYAIFENAQPIECDVQPADVIAQMQEYLKTHDSPRVRMRLERLLNGVKGVD